jgi:hypothetical protein
LGGVLTIFDIAELVASLIKMLLERSHGIYAPYIPSGFMGPTRLSFMSRYGKRGTFNLLSRT